jgi:hypothetical protein
MGWITCSMCNNPVDSRSAYICDECRSYVCADCMARFGGHSCDCQRD